MGEGTLVLTGVGENENEVVWVMFWAAVKLKREKAAQDKRRDMAEVRRGEVKKGGGTNPGLTD